MFKEAFKHKPFYWVLVCITSLLCYGFTLSNFSIGVDDESIRQYSNGGLVAVGRFGTALTKLIFDSYDFYPFFRDFIGLLLLILGFTLFATLFNKYSNGAFDEKACAIFTCISMSFPFIATSFVFSNNTIEIGSIIVLVTISLNLLLHFLYNKANYFTFIFSSLCLAYAISFFEYACIFFISGFFICTFLQAIYRKDKVIKPTEYIKNISIAIFDLLISLIVWKLVGLLMLKIMGLSYANYTSTYIKINYSYYISIMVKNIFIVFAIIFLISFIILLVNFIIKNNFIKNLIKFKKAINIGIKVIAIITFVIFLWIIFEKLTTQNLDKVSKNLNTIMLFNFNDVSLFILNFYNKLSNYTMNFDFLNICILLVASSLAIICSFSFYFAINKKSILIFFLGLCTMISPFGLYFLTGNLYLQPRAIINLSILIGFSFALLYCILNKNNFFNNAKIKYIFYTLIVLIVLNETKICTDIFFTDYKRYQLDLTVMNHIITDIEKVQNKNDDIPVLFVGCLEPYNLKIGVIEGHSIFNWDRNKSLYYELNTGRIFDFINMHGYKINKKQIATTDLVKEEIKDMSSYPFNGYIKLKKDFIIVKLGESFLEKS